MAGGTLKRVIRRMALRLAPAASFLPQFARSFVYKILFGRRSLPQARTPSDNLVRRLDTSSSCFGVNIAGYLRAELGVGEAARLSFRAMAAAGIPSSLIDVSDCCQSPVHESGLDGLIGNDNPYPVNLLHTAPDQVPVVAALLGNDFFTERYNVGCWVWELPEFPEKWRDSFPPFHEIWAPTQFVVDAVAAKSPVPVRRMPYPVDIPQNVGTAREKFSIPADVFAFLTMFDMNSFYQRKNPEAALKAFLQAFDKRDDVVLIVKTHNSGTTPEFFSRLKALDEQHANIVLMDKTLPRKEVWELENSCDAFVSLHRSEGFGLCLAECMGLGKPVVATGWSGNDDFMDEHNSCPVGYELVEIEQNVGVYKAGQKWADADVAQAADYMRRLVQDAAYREAISTEAARYIRETLSSEAIGARVREWAGELQETCQSQAIRRRED